LIVIPLMLRSSLFLINFDMLCRDKAVFCHVRLLTITIAPKGKVKWENSYWYISYIRLDQTWSDGGLDGEARGYGIHGQPTVAVGETGDGAIERRHGPLAG